MPGVPPMVAGVPFTVMSRAPPPEGICGVPPPGVLLEAPPETASPAPGAICIVPPSGVVIVVEMTLV